MKKREIWLDYLRVFACVLVCMGHLLMGFQDAKIMTHDVFSFAVDFIYRFHVYIFFFCSGYLQQKSFEGYGDRKAFLKNKIIRAADFLIVYVIFTGVTYLIKKVLSGDVNSPVEHTFFETLAWYPINQMWYMYAIGVITLCTPMLKTERTWKTLVAISLALKVVMCIPVCADMIPVPLNYLFDNQIWYVFGALWAYKRINPKKWIVLLITLFFVVVSTIDYFCGISSTFLNTLLTFTGLLASVGGFYVFTATHNKINAVWKLISRYMLQIYLLHTICAAGIRIVLIRLGIMNFWAHLPLGIVFSIAIPILCAMFCEKTKVLNILFFPSKTFKRIFKRN